MIINSGYGTTLQAIDSLIAETIMGYFIEHYNQVCLPIHDSFIVDLRYEQELRDIMNRAVKAVKAMSGAEIPADGSVEHLMDLSDAYLDGLYEKVEQKEGSQEFIAKLIDDTRAEMEAMQKKG